MEERVIDLKNYKKNDAKIFTNRDQGVRARKDFSVDDLDNQCDYVVKVLLPLDTWGINPSFFGGLFEGSLKNMSKQEFRDKYIFQHPNNKPLNDSLERDIEDDIDYVLRILYDED